MEKIFSSKFKIILGIFFAFLFVKFLSPSIFLANTPRIRPYFFEDLINSPKNFIASFFIKKNNSDLIIGQNPIPEAYLKTIAPGVKAYEDKKNNVLYIKYEKNAKFEKKVFKTPSGKTIEVYIPQGLMK